MQRATSGWSAKVALRYVASWAALSMVLELAWESAHVRLYTLWSDPDRWYVARAVLHCTLGDVAIGTIAYGSPLGYCAASIGQSVVPIGERPSSSRQPRYSRCGAS